MSPAYSPTLFRSSLWVLCAVLLGTLFAASTTGAQTSRASAASPSHSAFRRRRRAASGASSSTPKQAACTLPAHRRKLSRPRKVCSAKAKTHASNPNRRSQRSKGDAASQAPPAPAPVTVAPVDLGSLSAPGPTGPSSDSGTEPPLESSTPVGEVSTSKEPLAPFRFFSPSSFWNEAVPADAPLDPSSNADVGAFATTLAADAQAGKAAVNINSTAWSIPIYTVPADQPTVKVTLEDAAPSSALQSAWAAVPLPADAQPAAGSDEHLVVWQPSSEELWEFWHLVHGPEGWHAAWGGAMRDVATASGAYGPEAWPGAKPTWGASASSLSIAGGLITLEDLELGQINHALAMAIPSALAGAYAAPAERTDGTSTEPQALPEGAHLRLNPSLDLASLHLPRLTLMIAEAAQRYGIFIRDTAANVAFYAQDPTPTGTNPYAGPHGYLEGKTPQQLLSSFPWRELQLLKMELHSDA
jgi:hypothetical protein